MDPSVMKGANMGLSNLVPGGGMDPQTRSMIAQMLMQNQMRQPVNGPLGALANMASMYAVGQAGQGMREHEAAQQQARAEADEQKRQAERARAQALLAQLGGDMMGDRQDALVSSIGGDDPMGEAQMVLASLGREHDRNKPKGGGPAPVSYPVSGVTVMYDDKGQAYHARFNNRTGEFERITGAGRPVQEETGLPYADIDPIVLADPAAPRTAGASWIDPRTWFGGGDEAPPDPAAPPAAPPAPPAAASPVADALAPTPAAPAPRPTPTGPPPSAADRQESRTGRSNAAPPGVDPGLWAGMSQAERDAFLAAGAS